MQCVWQKSGISMLQLSRTPDQVATHSLYHAYDVGIGTGRAVLPLPRQALCVDAFGDAFVTC